MGHTAAKHRHDTDGVTSHNVDELRALLTRATSERRRAECLAQIQTDAVQLALDLLVREPDIEGYFVAFTKSLVEGCESYACAVWLLDEDVQRCQLWMAYLRDHMYMRSSPDWDTLELPREALATHLFEYKPGWNGTTKYSS